MSGVAMLKLYRCIRAAIENVVAVFTRQQNLRFNRNIQEETAGCVFIFYEIDLVYSRYPQSFKVKACTVPTDTDFLQEGTDIGIVVSFGSINMPIESV